MSEPLRYALIGCGGFGQFCLKAVAEMESVTIVAVADQDRHRAEEMAMAYQATAFTDPEAFFAEGVFDLVHIATPPHLHYELVLQAIRADRHVLCEKPLALTMKNAREMVALARRRGRILPVNFVLRYAEITNLVKQILDSGVFGKPLYAHFLNNAADENLSANHWMWNSQLSGGIFIEHGVHFFDLYRYWFDETELLSACSEKRPGSTTGQIDRVSCQMRHAGGTMTAHYHGFDQPNCLDRQMHKIVCETGDLTILGWIPEALIVNGIGNSTAEQLLGKLLPSTTEMQVEALPADTHGMRGRGKQIYADRHIRASYRQTLNKQTLYADAIRKLLTDQIHFIRDRTHLRVIDENNGLEALSTAEDATIVAAKKRGKG